MSKELFRRIIKEHAWMDLVKPLFWDGKLDKPVTGHWKISICTTCMNRLEDIKLTLPQNIEDNKDYPLLEFVLLDYNSKDGLGAWVKKEMIEHIKSGKLSYYRTEEPVSYSMAHSRNIAFKVANGIIVNSVDADNFVNKGFATYLNMLAHQQPQKAIFAKGKKNLRGRLGFYKKEFIQLLGGYDEGLTGYGSEDHDMMHRAWGVGMKLLWYGGKYYTGTPNHRKHQIDNFAEKDWKYTEKKNKVISYFNLTYKIFKANRKRHWGKAKLTKNFSEELEI